MLNAGACISCTCRHVLTQDKCGSLSESVISLLKAPLVQRNVKKNALKMAVFLKAECAALSWPRSSVDMNMYVCAEGLIRKSLTRL